MRGHVLRRTVVCQAVALAGFVAFMFWVGSAPTPRAAPTAGAPRDAAAAVFAAQGRPEPAAEPKPAVEPARVEEVDPPARRPERFRPASAPAEAETSVALPPASRNAVGGETVAVPPRDLPLSYLTQFRSVEAFHAFLSSLPKESDDAPDPMSLVRIENLPSEVGALRRLLTTYRMEPFLFNPRRFNYVITADGRLLRDRAAVSEWVANVGRYMREEHPNPAYALIRDEMVARVRQRPEVAEGISDPAEFGRMQLGLASGDLRRFLRRLEHDTADHVSQLTGRAVALRDIARIDCRFRDVNGALVLVPWKAWLGAAPSAPVDLWDAS